MNRLMRHPTQRIDQSTKSSKLSIIKTIIKIIYNYIVYLLLMLGYNKLLSTSDDFIVSYINTDTNNSPITSCFYFQKLKTIAVSLHVVLLVLLLIQWYFLLVEYMLNHPLVDCSIIDNHQNLDR